MAFINTGQSIVECYKAVSVIKEMVTNTRNFHYASSPDLCKVKANSEN